MPAPNFAILDSFNRTENPLSQGGNWSITNPDGTGTALKTDGTKAIRQGASGTFSRDGNTYTALTFGAGVSCEVGCTIANAGSDGEITLFLWNSGSTNGYRLDARVGTFGTNHELLTSPAGTSLGTIARAMTTGDRIALQIDGTKVNVWTDTGSGWVLQLNVTDTTSREAFQPAVEIAGLNDVTSAAIDNFGADSLQLFNAVSMHVRGGR